MNSLGENFKQYRKIQGFTLDSVSKNICSIPMLSRWENGTGKMDFKITLQLLERINLTGEEFINLTKLNIKDPIAQEIENAWANNQASLLKKIALDKLSLYNLHHHFIDLDYAAIACALYFDFSGENIFPLSSQNALNKQLSKITIWGQEYLSLFANATSILSPRIIYQISSQILENISFILKAGTNTFHFGLATLFEAEIGLILKGNINYAQNLNKQILSINIPENEMLLIVGRNFIQSLLEYLDTHNDTSSLTIITFLIKMNMKTTANYFLKILNSLKNKRELI